MNYKLAFGLALKRARNELGITQPELGERSGRHWTLISRLETGKVGPSVETIFLVSRGLGMPPSKLISYMEEEFTHLQV